MTPEMLAEIEEGLIERTDGFCVRVDQAPDAVPGSQAFGVIVVDSHGNALTVECRLADDGTAQVTASKHVDGRMVDPVVYAMPGSVLITT